MTVYEPQQAKIYSETSTRFDVVTESYNDEWIVVKPKPETQPFFFKFKRRPLWKNLLKSRSSYLKKL